MNSNTLFLPLLVALPLLLSVAALPLPLAVATFGGLWLLLQILLLCPIDDNVHILDLFDSSSSCKGYKLHLYPFFFYQS